MEEYESALSRARVGPIGRQWQQAPINHLCLHFPPLNNNFAAKFAVTGHYLMIPGDKEAISTLKVLAFGQDKQSTLSVRAEDTSGLTTSDYLGVSASCAAVDSPDDVWKREVISC